MSAYLDRDNFETEIGIQEWLSKDFQLYQMDNYDESKIMKRIKESGKISTYLAIAIQLSIVGYGKKKYGKVLLEEDIAEMKMKISNGEKFEMKKYGHEIKDIPGLDIIYSEKDAQLSDDALTLNRLIRFFRFHIQEYIASTGKSSYLYKNYAPIKKDNYDLFIFRGSEYCIPIEPKKRKQKEEEKGRDSEGSNCSVTSIENNLTLNEINELLSCLIGTYKAVDQRYKIDISDRIRRVLIARGLTEKRYDDLCISDEESEDEEEYEEDLEMERITGTSMGRRRPRRRARD